MTRPGPVGEEAAKLFEALGAWATARTGGATDETAGGAGTGPDRATAGAGHDASTCKVCPLCQVLALVRSTRPETFTHLLEASGALTAALRSFLEGLESEPREPRRGAPVERIDLDQVGRA